MVYLKMKQILPVVLLSSCITNPLDGAKFACDPDWQAAGASNPCGSGCTCEPVQGQSYKGMCACGGDVIATDGADAIETLGDTPMAEEVTPQGHYPPSATKNQIAALGEVNKYRLSVGLPVVDEDEALNKAAQAHAEFIVKNCQNYANSGMSPHQENPAWDGFTGVYPWDRADHFDYKSQGGFGQVIAFVNSPTGAVLGWMETLYHRLPLIDPASVLVGYGNAAMGGGTCNFSLYKKADVMNIGLRSSTTDVIVLFPPDKAVNIWRSFDGAESPQPPPPPSGYPSGTIVTVQFGKNVTFKLTGHKMIEVTDSGTTELPHVFLGPWADAEHGMDKDPNYQSGSSHYLAMYSHKPLKAQTNHKVTIDLIRGGKDLHLEWGFTTGNK